MELTNKQLEVIREATRAVEYGSVTVHIFATSKYLNREIQRRGRIESEPQKKNFRYCKNKKRSRVPMTPMPC
jgi:hypothetical protein